MTIVVGYSPSGQGMAALRSAVRYARRKEESLLVASHLYHDAVSGPTAASETAVRHALAEAGADGIEAWVRTCSEPDIGEFLLSVADEVTATLVVIGLRQKSPIGKLNLGSSARKVVIGAACPVLTVKDDPAATQPASA